MISLICEIFEQICPNSPGVHFSYRVQRTYRCKEKHRKLPKNIETIYTSVVFNKASIITDISLLACLFIVLDISSGGTGRRLFAATLIVQVTV